MIAHEVYDITYYKTSQGSVTAVTHFCMNTYHMLSYTSYDSSDSILLPKVGHNCLNLAKIEKHDIGIKKNNQI